MISSFCLLHKLCAEDGHALCQNCYVSGLHQRQDSITPPGLEISEILVKSRVMLDGRTKGEPRGLQGKKAGNLENFPVSAIDPWATPLLLSSVTNS